MTRKVLLMILDGWGIGKGDTADVVSHVNDGALARFRSATRMPRYT